jgi:hypothetical protein
VALLGNYENRKELGVRDMNPSELDYIGE